MVVVRPTPSQEGDAAILVHVLQCQKTNSSPGGWRGTGTFGTLREPLMTARLIRSKTVQAVAGGGQHGWSSVEKTAADLDLVEQGTNEPPPPRGRSYFVGPAKFRLTLPEGPSEFCRLAPAVSSRGGTTAPLSAGRGRVSPPLIHPRGCARAAFGPPKWRLSFPPERVL